MKNYLHFILYNRRFLAFGLLLTFFSSFGQTFFIALFSDGIRTDLGLSHGGFGTLYSLATLASAGCLMWLGRKIDALDLRLYAALVCAGLAGACFLMGSVNSVPLLALALLALRLAGQGLLSHTAVTSMGRYFQAERGRAISIASLGHSAGEAVLPLLAVLLMGWMGWRQAWLVIGTVLALVLVPVALWLLRGHGERHRQYTRSRGEAAGEATRRPSLTRREMLADPWFYRALPAVLATPFIMTGLFFHQAHLAAAKGWSLTWLASGFFGFAAAAIVGTLFAGLLVDRAGAVRLLPFFLLPLGMALLLLAGSDHLLVAPAYLTLAGLSAGANFAVAGSLWAEVYGVLHLGEIRALIASLMVFSTALSPAALGWLIDLGISMELIAGLCLGYVVLATALVALPQRRRATTTTNSWARRSPKAG